MSAIRLTDLRFSENAYFYKRKSLPFTKTAIEKMLNKITDLSTHKYLFNIVRDTDSCGVQYSVRVFKTNKRKPSFINQFDEYWTEQKIGYFIFIEYQDYVVILKKYAVIPNDVAKTLDPIDYNALINTYATAGTNYRKITLQNLDGSDFALRRKSFESLNLRNNISPIGSNQYYISSVSGDNRGNRFFISPNSSRINEFVTNKTINELCQWAKDAIDKITSVNTNQDNFMSIFAEHANYQTNYLQLKPSAILIFYSKILSVVNCEDTRIFHRKRELKDKSVFQKYMELLSRSFEVIDDGGNFVVPKANISISQHKSGIKLKSKTWDSIEFQNTYCGEYDGTLSSFINRHNQFNVYFTTSEFIYSNHALFKDSRLFAGSRIFLQYLYPRTELEDTLYEKYDSKIIKNTTGLKQWGEKSIFKFVEDEFKDDYDFFICDDCGEEWADHIGIANEKVSFFISKSKQSKHSASDFQDVIGQALKNLGNITPTKIQLDNKKNHWSKKYLKSSIDRFSPKEKNGTIEEAITIWHNNALNPGFIKEMCLVVDFLSKDEMETDLDSQDSSHKPETIQRLWFLSSFIHSCLEVGVTPKIYCKQK